jgi:hypothetical protein
MRAQKVDVQVQLDQRGSAVRQSHAAWPCVGGPWKG